MKSYGKRGRRVRVPVRKFNLSRRSGRATVGVRAAHATMKIKKLFGILIVLLICAVGFTACGGESLPRPEQVGINESMNILYWNEVEGASSYVVNSGEKDYSVKINQFSLDNLETGRYSLRVKAVGEGVGDSAWSETISFTKSEPSLLNLKLINGNSEYEVVGPGRATGVVTIENTYNGLPITAIADSAFEKCSGITEIVCGANVKSIGDRAFSDCRDLQKITFSDCLISIGAYAFQGCFSLKEAHIPDGVTKISEYAFSYATSLEKVTLPEGLQSIAGHSFSDCTSLVNITIPDSVEEVGEYAFSGAIQLESVSFGTGINAIADYAFFGCTSLTEIVVPGNVKSIGGYAFMDDTELRSVVLESGVEYVGEQAFYNCQSLENITIPSSVTYIGNYAFMESKLDSVSKGLVYAGNWLVGNNDDSATSISIAEGTVGISSGVLTELNVSISRLRSDILAIIISASVRICRAWFCPTG